MDRPDDPNLADETGDPFANEPDAWAESDRAWDARWSDDPDADDPDAGGPDAYDPDAYDPDAVDDTPPRVASGPASPRPTTTSVADSYLDGMQGAGPYLGLGMQIAASMAVFVGGGYAIDRWLGTSPVGLLIGAVIGMAGIVALVVRIARDADAENAARKARAKAKK